MTEQSPDQEAWTESSAGENQTEDQAPVVAGLTNTLRRAYSDQIEKLYAVLYDDLATGNPRSRDRFEDGLKLASTTFNAAIEISKKVVQEQNNAATA